MAEFINPKHNRSQSRSHFLTEKSSFRLHPGHSFTKKSVSWLNSSRPQPIPISPRCVSAQPQPPIVSTEMPDGIRSDTTPKECPPNDAPKMPKRRPQNAQNMPKRCPKHARNMPKECLVKRIAKLPPHPKCQKSPKQPSR